MIVVKVHILEYTDLLMNSNASKISQIWTKSEHGQSLGFVWEICRNARSVWIWRNFNTEEKFVMVHYRNTFEFIGLLNADLTNEW